MWSHIFLFGSLPRRRPPEFTAILMFEFWREATATSVRGLLCQSGRRRPENVSILSSLISVRPSETLARDWLNTNERQEMVMSTITLMNTIYNLSEKKITSTGTATCVTYSTDYYHWLALESWFTCLNWEQTLLNRSQQLPAPYWLQKKTSNQTMGMKFNLATHNCASDYVQFYNQENSLLDSWIPR